MKGIVFTEFLEMVESEFGYETVDNIISKSDLASGGVYTSVGTYAFSEMGMLLHNLSKDTDLSMQQLLNAFGKYLFNTFLKNYPDFFNAESSAFSFLESIENHIHVEVLKLYPDAELPKFETKLINEDTLEMIYSSERKMADFAEGLIEKTLEHYKMDASIHQEKLNESGSKVKFLISKN